MTPAIATIVVRMSRIAYAQILGKARRERRDAADLHIQVVKRYLDHSGIAMLPSAWTFNTEALFTPPIARADVY